jgi:hypothetical protein
MKKCSFFYGVDSKQYCLFRFHWRQIKGLRFMIKIATVRTITKGLLDDNPQRQRPKAVLRPYTLPSQSIISKSPSILIDPLLLIISFVLLMVLFIFEFKDCKIYAFHFTLHFFTSDFFLFILFIPLLC